MSFPLTPFTKRLGSESGRLSPPQNYAATDGQAALVLGSDLPGVFVKGRVGDFFEVSQQGDLLTGSLTYVRSRVVIRPPSAMPAGVVWRMNARVDLDGVTDSPQRVEYAITDLGRTANLLDLTLPVGGQVLTTTSAIAYRLQLTVSGQNGSAASIAVFDGAVFTVTPANNTFASVAHGLVDGIDVFVFSSGTLPAPLLTQTRYFIVEATADTFKLAASQGGVEIDVTTAGTGTHTVSTAEATLTGLTNQEPSSVGRIIAISGAATGGNNGQFVITQYLSATSVKIKNFGGAAPDANNGAIVWSVDEFEVELPGVYIDSVVLDASIVPQPALINRVPNPNENSVRVNTNIYLELTDPDPIVPLGGNIDVAATQVFINGQPAFNGGAFLPPFDGPESVYDDTIDGQRGLAITIDPTFSFEPQTQVAVLVFSKVVNRSLETYQYSFVTEDLIAPALLQAEAPARRTIRVTWGEDVVGENPAGAADALNPANWSITLDPTNTLDAGLPAYTPTVIGVSKFGSNIYDLILDDDMTGGTLYIVTAENIEDLLGNVATSPTNSITVLGAGCVNAPEQRRFELLDMLPDMNTAEDESRDLERTVKCFQEVTDVLLCDIDEWSNILDPDIASEPFVDAMLADLGNPFSFDLVLNDKRRLIRVLVPIYQQKGTEAGIINAIRFFLGIDVTIIYPAFASPGPWFLGVSEMGVDTYLSTADLHTRLTFCIVSPIVLTADQREKIIAIANYMKDARTHLCTPPIDEPQPPVVPDHWDIGVSELGTESLLH